MRNWIISMAIFHHHRSLFNESGVCVLHNRWKSNKMLCLKTHQVCLVRKLKNVFVHTWCVWLRGWRNSWSRFVLSTPPLAAVFYGIVEYVTVWYCIWKSMVWVWHWYYVALFCEAEYDMLEYNMAWSMECVCGVVWYVVNSLRGTSLKWQSVIYSKYSNDTVWHSRASKLKVYTV